jgi:hypothetical protein
MRIALSYFLFSIVIAQPAAAETDDFADATTEALCAGWRLTGNEEALSELVERAEFTEREWRAIHQQKLFVGMSENAAVCARGRPSLGSTSYFPFLISLFGSGAGVGGPESSGHTGNVTTETGDWGERTVYHHFYMNLYIFVENGVVVNYSTGDWKGGFEFERLPPPPEDAWYALPI